MNLPKLSALVIALLLATGWTLAWYVEGSDEVRAERMAVELETARFVALDAGTVVVLRGPEAAPEPAEALDGEPAPELRECPFVPGSDRV